MTITVERGDTLGEAYRRRITEVLVQGFAEDFEFFSKDPRVLADAFAHMILLDRFFVALVDGEPAAIASVTEGQQECFDPDRREIQRTLGGLRGLVCSFIVRSQFLGAYEGARPGLAEIGFVTTAPQYQGKGVATALMRHLLQLPYDEFVLRDIKDTNAPALGLYRKFGFTESSSRRVRFAGRAGFSAYVSMSLKAVAS
ncbi:GNAT family N-acetyltransferase [Microbacterium aurugineum]|uniref:GNAT family N-acetyltransferase n=1 Tax=Microbacterium aurugineum TaxID=2851642 RepID=UPI0020BEC133|nr:N-acetyltransferase [Microbacterium aurugineum]MCK8477996.1 GNAT family N-acetyltransferase [Microbacterium aurugineum]